jgi:hypothetical protein
MNEARGRQNAAGGRLSTALWELGLAEEVRLRSLGAEIFRVPPALPDDVSRAPEEVTRLLDREFVETYRVVPFARNRQTLLVATSEPWRLPLLDSIGSRLGCRVEPRFLDEAPLHRLLAAIYGLPVDERFSKEPCKRRVSATPDAAASTASAESSVFGSTSQLMSETAFEEIYRAEDAPPSPQPIEADPALDTPESRDTEVTRLLDAIDTWDPRYDTGRAAPLGLEEARAALAIAADPHQLGWVLVRHGLSLGRRVALLLHRAGVWMGWTGAGTGVSAETVAALMVPPGEGTIFGQVERSRAPHTGPLAAHPIHDRLHLVLGGGERPLSAALVPVGHGERLLLGIYFDGGPGGALPSNLSGIALLAREVPAVLERLARES